MPTDYDKIASQYRESKALPFREYIEWFSYRKMLGDISSKSILDLACGEGFYSRRLKQVGARKVVGVDISANMIELAETLENKKPLGITYLVGDALTMGKSGVLIW
jgi:ubiquinone/menaquinone biosynthesis C-methylase UbiE